MDFQGIEIIKLISNALSIENIEKNKVINYINLLLDASILSPEIKLFFFFTILTSAREEYKEIIIEQLVEHLGITDLEIVYLRDDKDVIKKGAIKHRDLIVSKIREYLRKNNYKATQPLLLLLAKTNIKEAFELLGEVIDNNESLDVKKIAIKIVPPIPNVRASLFVTRDYVEARRKKKIQTVISNKIRG